MLLSQSRILLVEDNDAHAEMVLLALEAMERPPQVDRFACGEEVIRWIDTIDDDGESELPTMAMIDLRLPRTSGLEVLARLRQSPKLGRIPIAILTSSSESEDRGIAEKLGVQAYLIKPVQLNQILDFALTNHRSPQP